jgi:hypothetical protein
MNDSKPMAFRLPGKCNLVILVIKIKESSVGALLCFFVSIDLDKKRDNRISGRPAEVHYIFYLQRLLIKKGECISFIEK